MAIPTAKSGVPNPGMSFAESLVNIAVNSAGQSPIKCADCRFWLLSTKLCSRSRCEALYSLFSDRCENLGEYHPVESHPTLAVDARKLESIATRRLPSPQLASAIRSASASSTDTI